MSKQRNIRKRRAVDDDDEIPLGEGDEDTQKPLSAEEIRFLQKQRHRKTVSLCAVFESHLLLCICPVLHLISIVAVPFSVEQTSHFIVLSIQGVEATTLAGAGSKASLPIEPTAAAADAGNNDQGMALHAAFNKERTRLAEADDPEM